VISRRTLLAAPLAAVLPVACGRGKGKGFRGYAFVANQDGGAIAAVDLEVLAVARHIPVDGSPTVVLAAGKRPSVYALTPENGSIHEIQADRLSVTRKLTVASTAVNMQLSPDERYLYVLARDPKAFLRISLDSFRVDSKIDLPADPIDLSLSADGRTAAVSLTGQVHLVDLAGGHLFPPSGSGDFGGVCFRFDGKIMLAANRSDRVLSVYDSRTAKLITHLPLALRPDNLCFKGDGGELFITGEGMDGVVIVSPYGMPEVEETVLAGRAPGPMAASSAFLFVASPVSGDVSILEMYSRKVIAVVSVGSDPGFVTVTPDDQYALVLNRKSGDVAVLRTGTITKNRYRSAALLTVIPVGSRPVSAAVRAV